MPSVESKQMWDSHWEKGKIGLQHHLALLTASEEVLGGFEGKKTLEIGAGRGIDSIRMAQKGAQAYAVDYTRGSIKITRFLKEHTQADVFQIQGAGENLPFKDNCFDLVFSQGLMEHPGEREKLLFEQARVTKPGGYVLIDVPNLISIQTPVRELQLLMGRWPYGKEYPFSVWGLKNFMEKAGLVPVKVYGWDLLPLLHLGLRDRLRRKRLVRQDNNHLSVQLNNDSSQDFFTRYVEVKFGQYFLNNVGVIAQKPRD